LADLTQLTKPVFVSNDVDARVAEFIARYEAAVGKTLYPAQPERLLIDLLAYADASVRAAIQHAGEQNLLAYAEGEALRNLAAFFNVTPLTGETAAALRERVRLAPEAFTVAGPAGSYRYHALAAHPDVADAYADSPAPGQVRVTVLAKTGLPPQAVLDAVQSVLSGETVRPLCDTVTTSAPAVTAYTIDALIQTSAGVLPSDAVTAATAAATAFAAGKSALLGKDVPISQVMTALSVPGVHRVILLTAPAADITLNRTQWAQCTGITVNYLSAASDE
jgi:phage-related baseplate assembly protein